VPGVLRASVTFLSDDTDPHDSDELIVEMARFDDGETASCPASCWSATPLTSSSRS